MTFCLQTFTPLSLCLCALLTMSCATTISRNDPNAKDETASHQATEKRATNNRQVDDQGSTSAAAIDSENLGDGFCQDDIYGSYLVESYKSAGKLPVKPSRSKRRDRENEAGFAAREVLNGPTRSYFGGIPVVANSHVERWINHFKEEGRPTFMKWLARSQAYRELVVPLLVKEGLPPEFFFLAMIESGFSNTAASSKRATGTWQFMSGTAKLYDLRIDHWVDERRDPVKSTVAAARYLRDLYAMFGDWYLAMAAYNAGPGKVKRAIRSAGTQDFWALVKTPYLRPETKNYVPKMLAALNLSINAKDHGFDVALSASHQMPLSNVVVDRPISLEEISTQLSISLQQLRAWNPELVREITPPRKNQTYPLRLTANLVDRFENLRDQFPFSK